MDENHRRYHSGRFTDNPDDVGSQYTKDLAAKRGDNIKAAESKAPIYEVDQHPDKNWVKPLEKHEPKRKDM
jgi:hypothetical protein